MCTYAVAKTTYFVFSLFVVSVIFIVSIFPLIKLEHTQCEVAVERVTFMSYTAK